jgi:hypothetical protein
MSQVPPDLWKFVWIAWLLWFGIWEFIAVKFSVPRGTFSEFVWWIMGSGEADREWYRWLARGLVAVLLVWLVPHFFTKWNWWN